MHVQLTGLILSSCMDASSERSQWRELALMCRITDVNFLFIMTLKTALVISRESCAFDCSLNPYKLWVMHMESRLLCLSLQISWICE